MAFANPSSEYNVFAYSVCDLLVKSWEHEKHVSQVYAMVHAIPLIQTGPALLTKVPCAHRSDETFKTSERGCEIQL